VFTKELLDFAETLSALSKKDESKWEKRGRGRKTFKKRVGGEARLGVGIAEKRGGKRPPPIVADR